jgi:hypothetical protein
MMSFRKLHTSVYAEEVFSFSNSLFAFELLYVLVGFGGGVALDRKVLQ